MTDKAHQQMISAWRAQARNKPWLTLSFAAIILIIAILLMVSIYQGLHLDNFYYALSGGIAGFVATAAGALLVFLPAAPVRVRKTVCLVLPQV